MSKVDTSAEFFERMYAKSEDPWNFAGSAYEQARYEATVDALRGRRYESAFEPGCSVGALTVKLAEVCDHVLAVDVSESAVKRARERCEGLPQVTVEVGGLQKRLDMRAFDLVVLSEIGYYFEPAEWERMCRAMVASMQRDAALIAVHWLGNSADHRMSGDEVHQILTEQGNLRRGHSARFESFRLDRWTKQ